MLRHYYCSFYNTIMLSDFFEQNAYLNPYLLYLLYLVGIVLI